MVAVDFSEIYKGEKVVIKLSKEAIKQLSNGKILEGFKTQIGMEVKE